MREAALAENGTDQDTDQDRSAGTDKTPTERLLAALGDETLLQEHPLNIQRHEHQQYGGKNSFLIRFCHFSLALYLEAFELLRGF